MPGTTSTVENHGVMLDRWALADLLDAVIIKTGIPLPSHIEKLLRSVLPLGFRLDDLRLKKGTPFWLPKENEAITLGTTIRVRDEFWEGLAGGNGKFQTTLGTSLLAHELYHVYQWRAFPLGQVPWYIIYIMIVLFFSGRKHPLEKPAYKFGDAIGAALVQALARTGFADLDEAFNPTTGELSTRFLNEWEREVPELEKHFRRGSGTIGVE